MSQRINDCPIKRPPIKNDPRVWLWKTIGPEVFSQFQRKFGGRKIWIPKHGNRLPCPYCLIRNRCIKNLHLQGKSIRFLAKRFGLSTKHVYALLK